MNPVLTFALALLFCGAGAYGCDLLLDRLAVTLWPLPRQRRRAPPAGPAPLSSRAMTIIVMGLVAAIILFCTVMARAHENGQPNWITEGKYSGPDGIHCCGPNDCERLSSDEVLQRPDGLWLIRFKELVPYSEATPSEDGQYWRCHRYTGERRCFFAPVGSQ